MSDQNDLAVAFYNAARAELVMRLQLRDQAVSWTSAGLSAILRAGLISKDLHELRASVLLEMSPISIGAMYIVLNHAAMIAHLAKYLEKQTKPIDKTIANENPIVISWKNQTNYAKHTERATQTVTRANVCLCRFSLWSVFL